jgi:hypothetical protein
MDRSSACDASKILGIAATDVAKASSDVPLSHNYGGPDVGQERTIGLSFARSAVITSGSCFAYGAQITGTIWPRSVELLNRRPQRSQRIDFPVSMITRRVITRYFIVSVLRNSADN